MYIQVFYPFFFIPLPCPRPLCRPRTKAYSTFDDDSTHKLREPSSSPSLTSSPVAHKALGGLLGPSSTGEVDDSTGWL